MDAGKRFSHICIALLILVAGSQPLFAEAVVEIEPARIIQDGLGRQVEIPEDLTRIVVGGSAALMVANAVYMFPSAPELIVGVSRIDQGRGNFLEAIDPDYGEKTVLERNIGAEQIAALQPDVVIMKSFMKGPLGDSVELLGIPVVYVELETPEQYDRDLRILGNLLNEQPRAAVLAEYYEQVVRAATTLTSDLPESSRPEVLFLNARATGGDVAFNVPPASWLQTTLVQLAGGRPVWASQNTSSGWLTVGFEQIAAWDPDKIFVVAYRDDVAAFVEGLRQQGRWRELTAVGNGEIYPFPWDYYSWDQPDVRWGLGLSWLATRIQPELFDSSGVKAAVYRFFSLAYGMTAGETDSIILDLVGDLAE